MSGGLTINTKALLNTINAEDLPILTPLVTSGSKTPLVINGTMGSDHFRLDNRDGIVNFVRDNVIVSSHAAADIAYIAVALRGGNDSLIFSGNWNIRTPIDVTGGSGRDTIKFQYTFGPGFKIDPSISVRGGSDADLIEGTLLVESLYGDAGNDTIHGGSNDRFHDDIVDGGAGDDTISAFGIVHGGADNDTIFGSKQVFGDGGHDKLSVGNVGSTLRGGEGNDTLTGGTDADFLQGGGGNDSLSGGTGADVLAGDAGNDTLRGGADFDTMFGGANDDTFFASGDGSRDFVYGGSGRDTADVDNRGSSIFFWEVQDAWTEVEVVRKH
jgi:Ca2+-binding RTX toxin-like protein